MKKLLENGRTIGKRKRERYLTWKELLTLPPDQLIPTIKSQGRPSITEKQLLDKANKLLFQKAKNDYTTRRINTLLNNLSYLKTKHNLTIEIMDEMMIKYSSIDKPIRYNNFSLNSGLRTLSDVFEYTFAYGYAFNVSTRTLLTENLEYLDSINCADPFEYYIGNASDLDLPIIVNTTTVHKTKLMRQINREQRTGIKNKNL